MILDLGVRRQARRARASWPHALAERRAAARRRAACSRCCSSARALQSTGIGDGVAIPHGKLPGLERLLATFARSRRGVDFESIDGQPTHLFFLLVVPEHSGGQHLKALARISRFFRDAGLPQAPRSRRETREDVLRAIEEEDAKF